MSGELSFGELRIVDEATMPPFGGSATLIPLVGSLTLDTMQDFKLQLLPHLRPPNKIVFDCTGLVRIDESGKSMLTKIRVDYQNTQLKLVNVNPKLQPTLSCLGKSGILVEFRTEAA